MSFHASSARLCGERLDVVDAAERVDTWVTPVSSARMSCVLRAMRAANSVGSAIASSKRLVCRLCVPPSTAASASTSVRTMLLYGSCSVSDTPDVWQCVRSISDPGFFGLELPS